MCPNSPPSWCFVYLAAGSRNRFPPAPTPFASEVEALKDLVRMSPGSRNCPPLELFQGSHLAKCEDKGLKGNEIPFESNLMSAPRLHLGGKGQPPQRENVVSSVSELWRLCQLSRRHKAGLLTHRRCNWPVWRKAPKDSSLAGLGNFR